MQSLMIELNLGMLPQISNRLFKNSTLHNGSWSFPLKRSQNLKLFDVFMILELITNTS